MIKASSAAASATRASSIVGRALLLGIGGPRCADRDIERAQREVAEKDRGDSPGLNAHDGMPGRVRAGELEPHLVGELVAVVDTVDDTLGDERVECVETLGRPPAARNSSSADVITIRAFGNAGGQSPSGATTAAMPMPSRWLSTTVSTRSGGTPAARIAPSTASW